MLRRLAGLENEYAIRFSPLEPSSDPEGELRPGNDKIADAMLDAIRGAMSTLPGQRRFGWEQLFVENGGSLNYEALPEALDGGLIEAATPECRGPSQLLLYQKAQERMLLRAAAAAQVPGLPGEVGLLRNCRDAEGHVYGAQENYEVPFARGPLLWLWRLDVVLTVPLVTGSMALLWALVVALLVSALAGILAASAVAALAGRSGWIDAVTRRLEDPETFKRIALAESRLERTTLVVMKRSVELSVRLFGFRDVRREVAAFLISRPVISGAGTLMPDGAFWLSEKGPDVKRVVSWVPHPAGRGVVDIGNLLKQAAAPGTLDFDTYFLLMRSRQRLQLGLADGNRCQVAEYIKLGVTMLVLDMCEDGALIDAPRMKDPVDALQRFISDPTLQARASLRGPLFGPPAGDASALEIQRWYLERARSWVAAHPSPALEAPEILRLWGEALDGLERDPESLVGRLDWVTKRYLIETAGAGLSHAARKKIDLRYHELGDGYLAQMEDAGLAPVLVDPDEAEAAVSTPPDQTPAKMRGRLIRELAAADVPASASWATIRIRGDGEGRVIQLDEWRRDRGR